MKRRVIKNLIIYFSIIIMILFFPFKKKIHYNNGILMQKYTYSLIYGGVMHGKDFEYYENGKLHCVLRYKHGELNGESKYFYQNGSLKCIVIYEDNKPIYLNEYYDFNGRKVNNRIVNGNGYLKLYNNNGLVENEGKVLNGLKEGIWKYYPSGDTSRVDSFAYQAGIDIYGFYDEIIF